MSIYIHIHKYISIYKTLASRLPTSGSSSNSVLLTVKTASELHTRVLRRRTDTGSQREHSRNQLTPSSRRLQSQNPPSALPGRNHRPGPGYFGSRVSQSLFGHVHRPMGRGAATGLHSGPSTEPRSSLLATGMPGALWISLSTPCHRAQGSGRVRIRATGHSSTPRVRPLKGPGSPRTPGTQA